MDSENSENGVIVTLKITLGTSWSSEIEFRDTSTLDELHDAIQHAVDFDNDHLYEFYVARSERARQRTVYYQEDGGIFDTQIRDLFPLPPKHQLFYLFDFGDSWLFKITKTRKAAFKPIAEIQYPRIANETGNKPEQYENDDFE